MFDKVNEKDKEYNSNNAFRPLFIVLFIAAIVVLTIFNGFLTGGLGVTTKGMKPAKEKKSNPTSNIIVEPTSNEIVVPTSNVVIPEKGEATYKIVHKYEQLDGTYLDEKITNKGAIDSEVTPEVKGKEGYKNPTIQKVKIKEDGTTVIEYVYNLEKYTLTVNNYEFIEEGNVSGEYKYGSKVTLTAKERDNHEFTKWSTGDTISQITITITKNTNIDLIYDKSAFIVNYNGNGYEVNPETIIVNKGNELGTLPTPDFQNHKTHIDYYYYDSVFESLDRTFDGWYTDLTGGIKVDENYMPEDDITLYARYSDPCKGLATDLWKNIAKNVESQSDYYPLGCTKDIELDTDKDGTKDSTMSLVVVNNTTPAECNNSNFSQTACGFVMEFENIESKRSFSENYNNSASWENSDLRQYLNNDLYESLPSDLKEYIISTRIVSNGSYVAPKNTSSGYFSNNDIVSGYRNVITDDKIYISSLEEVGRIDDSGYISENYTKTLDIYKEYRKLSEENTCSDCSVNEPYWVRNTYVNYRPENGNLLFVSTNPYINSVGILPKEKHGVVPLLKIGNTGYTIKYNTNGGIKLNDTNVPIGETLVSLPVPQKVGMIFDGWYTELNGGVKVTDGYTPTHDITLYARYIDSCNNFENDSWDTIKANIKNKIDYYPVGCTKKVNLEPNNDAFYGQSFTLRILNNTYDEKCNNAGAAETSCGFILGFDEIVFETVLNMENEDIDNGWVESNIRNHLNDSLYNALPYDLSKNIIDTKVLSGYNSTTGKNNITTDKFYMLSGTELYGVYMVDDDIDSSNMTQLDYYEATDTQLSKLNGNLIKNFKGKAENWMTMSSYKLSSSTSSDKQYIINEDSNISSEYASFVTGFYFFRGVSPAFRLDTSSEEKSTYTVIYDSNGRKTDTRIKKIDKGNNIGSLPVPQVLNGEFIGWYTELNGGTKVDENYVPNDDVTLYARYNDSCNNFESSSWDTIVANINNQTDYYPLGCRKNIYLDVKNNDKSASNSNNSSMSTSTDGLTDTTYVVRVANNSSNDKCRSDDYSETACGFVLEFEDISSIDRMQYGNPGAWPESSIRSKLKNLFKYMQQELKDNMIFTHVLSGNAEDSNNNFKTIDRLYLFSPLELWGNPENDGVDNRYTRQLDYYQSKNVTPTNTDSLIKKYNGTATRWWTRSGLAGVHYDYNNVEILKPFAVVGKDGSRDYSSAWTYDPIPGISAAFRLGKNRGYKIQFDTNGGNFEIEDILIEFGDTIPLPNPGIPHEYTFLGWYTELNGGIKITKDYVPTSDMKLYARYEPGCKDFETASWDTIKTNVENNSSYYAVGCEKTVSLDLDNDGTAEKDYVVRVSNNSESDSCNDINYSKTACGFTVEFKDIISKSVMNTTNTNNGGWEESKGREYVNSTIYDALPADLKAVISPTIVVTGHKTGANNTITVDKLFLLSEYELFGSNYFSGNESTFTRQFDYYKNTGTGTENVKDVKKYNNATFESWLRTPYDEGFLLLHSLGRDYYDSSSNNYGISPAFKIGSQKYSLKYKLQDGTTVEIDLINVGSNIEKFPEVEPPLMKKFVGWYTDVDGGEKVSIGYIPSGDMTLYARFVDACSEFNNDSWATIKSNVDNELDYYPVGCTKDVDLDLDKNGTTDKTVKVRVANNTKPATCSTEGYSHTACGFVVEFDEIISQNQMNSTNTNKDGWTSSIMRKYVNDDLYNALPSDLQEVITPTRVISGYGSLNTNNFKTIDKLYLLSTVEVYGELYRDTVNSDLTRQLDYYKAKGVNRNNSSDAIKKYNSTSKPWWLRTSTMDNSTSFNIVGKYRNADYAGSYYSLSVSPAFRVGTSDVSYYEIKFNSNNESDNKTILIEVGESIETLPTPEEPFGMKFDGWYTNLTDGEKVSDGYIPSGSITLYAKFIDLCNDFSTDSWETIQENVIADSTHYVLGCEKTIGLDLDNDGTAEKNTKVRIVNNTTPDSCANDIYSQTACGFVLEFEDIIDIKEMSSSTVGGWSNASLRQYANNDIYNALPNDLKSIIIPTKVVSGYTAPDTININSLDKLYPLSLVEIYDFSNEQIDTLTSDYTRQLDLYSELGVTERNVEDAIKMYESENISYWLRTPYSGSNYLEVQRNGDFYFQNSSSKSGVSLAFRIGTSNTEYYTVSYNSNGGGYVGESIVEAGKSISKLPTPVSLYGYGFVGWYTSLTDGEKVSDGYTPSGNVTFYARYEDVCNGFDTASWSTISSNINNQLDYYGVGCKKAVELDLDQDGTTDKTVKVRVSNNTNPSECSADDHSQTACGFVLEFDEIIDVKPMNESGESSGGYPATTLKSYIDNTLYNALPSDLKDTIIDTKAYYSYSGSDTDNFVSTDKLYLPSVVEVYGIPSLDTINSRQLDYYSKKGLSGNGNYSVALKKNGNTYGNWWLSTPYDEVFIYVTDNEYNPIYFNSPSEQQGVSPLFRIG